MTETFTPPGSNATVRTVQDKLLDRPLDLLDYYKTTDGNNYSPAMERITGYYANNRVNPPTLPANNGTGIIEMPKGNFRFNSQIVLSSVQGGGIIGSSEFTTTIIRNFSAVESGIYMETYTGIRFADFGLFNESPTRGSSYGLFLNPTGGGGGLSLDRVTISGFHVGAYVVGDVNGDKSLWSRVTFLCDIGWSNGNNKQAIGHTFINANGGCAETFWDYGGSGSTVVLNGTVDVYGTLLRLPENAGTLQAGMFALYGVKSEYHGQSTLAITNGNASNPELVPDALVAGSVSKAFAYVPNNYSAVGWTGSFSGLLPIIKDTKAFTPGEQLTFSRNENGAPVTYATATAAGTQTLSNLLIDARPSVLNFDAGGSAALLSLNQVWHTSGATDPASDQHVVVKVGNNTSGSDRIIVQARGCYIRGKVQLASSVDGGYAASNRWLWEDNVSAPLPSEVDFQGSGSHTLQEWHRNHNVPVDQYRGGQAFVGAIDFQKGFLWRHVGKALVNTGLPAAKKSYSGRVGGQFVIDGFPPKCTFTGLCAFIDSVPYGSDTLIEWFATDGGTTWANGVSGNTLLGSALISAGFVGLYPVVMNDATKWQTGSKLYVRITKPGENDLTFGALVPIYFPYMGT